MLYRNLKLFVVSNLQISTKHYKHYWKTTSTSGKLWEKQRSIPPWNISPYKIALTPTHQKTSSAPHHTLSNTQYYVLLTVSNGFLGLYTTTICENDDMQRQFHARFMVSGKRTATHMWGHQRRRRSYTNLSLIGTEEATCRNKLLRSSCAIARDLQSPFPRNLSILRSLSEKRKCFAGWGVRHGPLFTTYSITSSVCAWTQAPLIHLHWPHWQ